MKFIKNILDRNNLAIAVSGACEKCGRKIEVPLSNSGYKWQAGKK